MLVLNISCLIFFFGSCVQKKNAGVKGFGNEKPLTLKERILLPDNQKRLWELFRQSGVVTGRGLAGFQAQSPVIYLHDWLTAGLIKRENGIFRYDRIHFVYLDEYLTSEGVFRFKEAKFNLPEITQWMYVIDPQNYRIRVTGRTHGKKYGYPRAVWYPIHSQLAAQNYDISALESRSLGAGLFHFDPNTFKLLSADNTSGHFLIPDMTPLVKYLQFLFELHGKTDIKFRILGKDEHGQYARRLFCGIDPSNQSIHAAENEFPPDVKKAWDNEKARPKEMCAENPTPQ